MNVLDGLATLKKSRGSPVLGWSVDPCLKTSEMPARKPYWEIEGEDFVDASFSRASAVKIGAFSTSSPSGSLLNFRRSRWNGRRRESLDDMLPCKPLTLLDVPVVAIENLARKHDRLLEQRSTVHQRKSTSVVMLAW